MLKLIFTFLFLMYLYPITIKAEDNNSIAQQRIWAAKGDSCVQTFDYFHALQYYKQLDTTIVNNNLPVVRNMAEIYHRTGNNKAWFNTLVRVYSSQPDSMTYNDMRSLFFASRSIEWDDFITMIGNKILKTNPYDSEIVFLWHHTSTIRSIPTRLWLSVDTICKGILRISES